MLKMVRTAWPLRRRVEVRCQAADRLDAVHLLSGAVATGSGRVLPVLDVDVGDDAAAVVTNCLPLQEAAPFVVSWIIMIP